jgi:hypothetical protein
MATVQENKVQNSTLTQEVGRTARTSGKLITQIDRIKPANRSIDYEIVFVVDDAKVDIKAFDFALESAQNFSSPMTLVYITRRNEIPDEYVEFANREGVRDYEWQYFNWVAQERFGELQRKAENAGISLSIQTQNGGVKNALENLSREKRTLVVINPTIGGRSIGKKLQGIIPGASSQFPVPVFVY